MVRFAITHTDTGVDDDAVVVVVDDTVLSCYRWWVLSFVESSFSVFR